MKRIPGATYRLQFNSGFTFQQAGGILNYLRELGISDVYASPLFQAGLDSTHGYDTCDFDRINSNIGSAKEFDQFADELKRHDLGLLLDLVPNHMSATPANPWWVDVLENGRKSPYASFFDIDWCSENPALRDKVLLPVLEDHFGKVLEAGKLKLVFEGGKFFIAYYDRKFPVNSETIAALGIANSETMFKSVNGAPGNMRSFDKLDALIQSQHYRLAYWRAAAEEINYRRFFDVTEMVALKMESPEVFEKTHRLVFEWLKQGRVTGLRIDHPDGLWDPKQYLDRLQKDGPLYVVVEKILSGNEQLPRDWLVDGTTGYDFLNRVNGLFVDGNNAGAFDELYREFAGNEESFDQIVHRSRKQVLEKSFGSELNALAHRLAKIAGCTRGGMDLAYSQLRDALEEVVASFPVYRTYIIEDSEAVSEQDRAVIQEALRSAREHAEKNIEPTSIDFIEQELLLKHDGEVDAAGLREAREFVMKFQQLTGPAMAKGLEDTAFYRFNRLISLNEVGGDPGKFGVSPAEFHELNRQIAEKWPHTLLASATHDTKRGEDVRARLNVLSEMPGEWRETVKRWAQMNRGSKSVVEGFSVPTANDEFLLYQTLVGAWPGNLSEPEALNSFRERIVTFMLKAVKEAKVNTSWTEPHSEYENALQQFIESTLNGANHVFLRDLETFARRIAFFGRINSLAQTLLKMTSPGVPDFYQGSEFWDLNLVDPDNRRPVDYAARQNVLATIQKTFESVADAAGDFFGWLLRDEEPGGVKLFLIWRVLNFRRSQRDLFDSGTYVPLLAVGEQKEHVCAFARVSARQTAVVLVPRLVLGLTRGLENMPIGSEIWKDTALQIPRARAGDLFRNVLTREMVPAIEKDGAVVLILGQALKSFPVALLEKI
jgi:(1->4)-alpha-D-glucan 1-alpha-D-glucosylmutase